MFNVYEFDKQQQEKANGQREKQVRVRRTSQLRTVNKELIHNYRNRVGSFIKTMIMSPDEQMDQYHINQDNLLSSRHQPQNNYHTISTSRSPRSHLPSQGPLSYKMTSGIVTNRGKSTIQQEQSMELSQLGDYTIAPKTSHRHHNLTPLSGSAITTQRQIRNGSIINNQLRSARGGPLDSSCSRSNTYTNYGVYDTSKRTNEGFRFTSTQRERVDIALIENSRLESTPTKLYDGNTHEKLMNLRPRDKQKELGPPSFKFKPNNFFEKVAERLNKKNANNSFKTNEVFSHNLLNSRTGTLAKNIVIDQTLFNHKISLPFNEGGKHNLATHTSTSPSKQGDAVPTSNEQTKVASSRPPMSADVGSKSPRKQRFVDPGIVRVVRPQQLLPILHKKTHYKAALEYKLGDVLPHKSLKDETKEIEKLIQECQVKLQRDTQRRGYKSPN